jgi:hypothetical protein
MMDLVYVFIQELSVKHSVAETES